MPSALSLVDSLRAADEPAPPWRTRRPWRAGSAAGSCAPPPPPASTARPPRRRRARAPSLSAYKQRHRAIAQHDRHEQRRQRRLARQLRQRLRAERVVAEPPEIGRASHRRRAERRRLVERHRHAAPARACRASRAERRACPPRSRRAPSGSPRTAAARACRGTATRRCRRDRRPRRWRARASSIASGWRVDGRRCAVDGTDAAPAGARAPACRVSAAASAPRSAPSAAPPPAWRPASARRSPPSASVCGDAASPDRTGATRCGSVGVPSLMRSPTGTRRVRLRLTLRSRIGCIGSAGCDGVSLARFGSVARCRSFAASDAKRAGTGTPYTSSTACTKRCSGTMIGSIVSDSV